MTDPNMTSSKPYLIRAMFDWIVENDCTPHIVVDAECDGVAVPEQYIEDGKIILNIAPRAVRDFELGQEWILFDARFSGQSMEIQVPVFAVLAIYAQENGRGMVFSEEGEDDGGFTDGPPTGNDAPPRASKKAGKPNLRVVK